MKKGQKNYLLRKVEKEFKNFLEGKEKERECPDPYFLKNCSNTKKSC